MNNIKTLHAGCDGLTVALMGAMPDATLQNLEAAKASAAAMGGDSLMTIGGVTFNVMQSGTGSAQGYTFQFHTGRHGIKYQVKNSIDPSQWNLRARASAMFLAENGIEEARNQIYQDLLILGATIIEESVSNVDFCVDLIVDEKETTRAKAFKLEPQNFMHHSRSTKRQFYSENEDESGTLSVFGKKWIESVTIGGRKSRQLCVYNKRAEQRSKRRSEWFEFWGEDKEDCPNIWRVEYRFSRDFLRDWNIRTIAELIACYGRLIEDSLIRIRYVELGNDKNLSRAPNHPFWAAVISAFSDLVLTCEIDGLERGRITRATREDFKQIYISQICGLASGVSYILKLEDSDDGRAALPSIISKIIEEHLRYKPDKHDLSVKKAKTRMYFLREKERENA